MNAILHPVKFVKKVIAYYKYAVACIKWYYDDYLPWKKECEGSKNGHRPLPPPPPPPPIQ